jgi:hypothetical protein
MSHQKDKAGRAREIRVTILSEWPDAFCDGYAWGAGLVLPGPRDAGGYPIGFHEWPADKKRAWEWGLKDALYFLRGIGRE